MGLRQRLASYAVGSAHVLVVEVPGAWGARVALERALAARGWRVALSPADADALVVCGVPGTELGEVVERVWEQLPGPRARGSLRRSEDAAAVLDEVAAALLDDGLQRADAAGRGGDQASAGGDHAEMGHGDMGDGGMGDGGMGDGGMDHGGMGDGGMDHGGMDHGGMDHGGMDHGGMGHGDMGHGDMAPAGIPLARGGEDRDGLEMDVLHVPLGPVLPHWPAGLVLRCALQGDVVTEADVEVLAGSGEEATPPPSPAVRAARRCDAAARVLALAGWDDAATAARRTCDELLAGAGGEATAARLDRLVSRVSRSWTLRWQLRGLGRLDDAALAEHGLPPDARGDVRDRLLAMLRQARADAGNDRPGGARTEGAYARATLAALPALVTGLDLAAARLVVASLDPDTAAVAREAVHA